jgi:hypothetical protein
MRSSETPARKRTSTSASPRKSRRPSAAQSSRARRHRAQLAYDVAACASTPNATPAPRAPRTSRAPPPARNERCNFSGSSLDSSNLMVRPVEVVKPNLVSVGAVLVRLARGPKFYAPARTYHHAAHLVARGRAERRVREVGLFDRLLCDFRLPTFRAEPRGPRARARRRSPCCMPFVSSPPTQGCPTNSYTTARPASFRPRPNILLPPARKGKREVRVQPCGFEYASMDYHAERSADAPGRLLARRTQLKTRTRPKGPRQTGRG